MAATLKAKIILDGAEQIERQLEGLGDKGRKVFADIANEAEKVGGFKNLQLGADQINAKLAEVGLVGPEAFNKIRTAVEQASRLERLLNALTAVQNGLAGVGNAALSVVRALGPLGLVLGAVAGAAAAAGAALAKSAIDAAQAGNQVAASAIKFGTTLQQYQDLRAGFNQAGIASKTFNEAMGELKKNLDPAATAQVKQLADNLIALKKAGITDPSGFQRLAQLATGTGEAAKIAQEALKQLGSQALQFRALPQITDLTDALSKLGVQATDASGKLRTVAQAAPEVISKLAAMKDGPERTALAIKALGQTAGVELIQALNRGGQAVIDFNNKYRQAGLEITASQAAMAGNVVASYNRVIAAMERLKEQPSFFSPAAIAILNAVEQTLIRLGAFLNDPSWANFAAVLEPGWELLKQGASIAWEFVKSKATEAFNAVITKAGEMLTAITTAVTTPVANAWQWIVTTFDSVLAQVLAKATAIAARIRDLFTRSPAGAGPSLSDTGDVEGRVGGGLIGGRGTGTSDSNLIRASRGEFVNRQKSVDYYGTPLFHALNQMRIPRERLFAALRDLRGHKFGGLIGDVVGNLSPLRAMPMPAYAQGGPVGGDKIFLQFGGQTMGPMHAAPDVVEELRKAAVLSQVRSGGRKPSWF